MFDRESTAIIRARKVRGFATCLLLAVAVANACTVSDTGLDPAADAGSACGEKGTPMCPTGLTSQASWPAGTCYAACIKPCGPDDIAMRLCTQTDRATCQAESGCVCLDTPCVACADCAFLQNPSECYIPTNAATAPPCATGVTQGGACGSACDRRLCLLADGKTGCVCNDRGKYACATWGGTGWK